jgi:hypothetical protein
MILKGERRKILKGGSGEELDVDEGGEMEDIKGRV